MGFFKQNGKDYKKDTTIFCKHCGSTDCEYVKLVGFGRSAGKVYHYKRICLKCGKRYNVKRSKYVYDKVKDQKWLTSKSYKKIKLGQELIEEQEKVFEDTKKKEYLPVL